MNIQRGLLEGELVAAGRFGGSAGWSLSRFFAEPAPGSRTFRPGSGGGRPPRVPDRDIVLIGREARAGEPAREPAQEESARGTDRSPEAPKRARLRRGMLLALAAYYMGWGLYTGIGAHKARPIYVNPTLNGRTVIT